MTKSTKFWIAVFAALLIVCAALFFIFRSHKSGAVAGIYQNGELLQSIDLDSVVEPYELTIETKDGGYNVIYVEHGQISVVEASCPDRVCINQGCISDGLVPIVCLPNRLVIQIESGEK